jgi:hypothetical protein
VGKQRRFRSKKVEDELAHGRLRTEEKIVGRYGANKVADGVETARQAFLIEPRDRGCGYQLVRSVARFDRSQRILIALVEKDQCMEICAEVRGHQPLAGPGGAEDPRNAVNEPDHHPIIAEASEILAIVKETHEGSLSGAGAADECNSTTVVGDPGGM